MPAPIAAARDLAPLPRLHTGYMSKAARNARDHGLSLTTSLGWRHE